MARVRLIGDFTVVLPNRAVTRWPLKDASALVKILSLTPSRSLHRERVMDLLWPDLDPVDAAPRLHKAAHFARQATGERDAVVLRGETVALFPGARVVVDIEQLEEAFAAAGGGTAEDAAAVLDAFPGEVPAGGRSAMPVLPCWAGPAGCAGCVPGWMVGSRSGRCPVLVSCAATVVSLVLWCSE